VVGDEGSLRDQMEVSMSNTDLQKKLRILGDQHIALLNAPKGYLSRLGSLPKNVELQFKLEGATDLDIVHAFYTQMSQLQSEASSLVQAFRDDGILWISYPKLSAKTDSDLNRDLIWKEMVEFGVKAVAQISIDDVWSAIRFKHDPI
jgi:hypothetical protein